MRAALCAILAIAACHEDSVLFAGDDGDDGDPEVPVDCQVCDPDAGCGPAPDGTPCSIGLCDGGVCVTGGSCDGGSRWTSVAAGDAHSCAATSADQLWCWGRNTEGQLGLGDTAARAEPARLPGDADQVAAGGKFSCALDAAVGSCWGKNGDGQLGAGATSAAEPSALPVAGDLAWLAVDGGGDHACGVTDGDALLCWGKNTDGELGVSGLARSAAPVPVDGAAAEWQQVAAGKKHTCAIDRDARLWCWGANMEGQLGTGDVASRDAPVEIGAGLAWAHVDAGGSHSCAIDALGGLHCWGSNREDQLGLGDGAVDRVLDPEPILPGIAWQAIALGDRFTCAIAEDRALWCWGSNDAGQLGDATTAREPRQLNAASDWVAVAAGQRHACAIRVLGSMFCWGDNREGQLGIGEAVERATPTEVCGDTTVE